MLGRHGLGWGEGLRRGRGAIALGVLVAGVAWGKVAAAIEPGERQGELDGTEITLADGSFYDEIELELAAGESVAIALSSDEFDTFLILLDGAGHEVVRNDDGDGTDAQILTTAAAAGTYRIVATSYEPGATGAYRLSWQAATATEVKQFMQRQEANRLLQAGIQQYRTSQFREALQSWGRSLAIFREIGDRQGEANSLGNLGLAYDSLGQYERAIDFHQQSLVIERAIGDRQGEAASLGNLGNVYDSLGQYERAIDFYQQALAIEQEIGDRQGEANSLGNLGNVYHSLGQSERAIDFHQQQLTIARAIGDRQGEANSLGNLGNVYHSLGQYERAIDFHQRSLAIKREMGDRQGEANSLGNLGLAYDFLGQSERAIDFHQQYLAIARAIGDRQGEAASLGNLGLAYHSLGQFERAITFHQQALAIKREIGDRRGEAVSLNDLSLVYRNLNRLEDAEAALRQSLATYDAIRRDLGNNDANKISFFEEQLFAYRNLQRTLALADRPEAALEIADRARARSLAEFLASDRPDAPITLDLDGIRQVVREQNATAIVYSDLRDTLLIWVVRPNGRITLRTQPQDDTPLHATILAARGSATSTILDGRGAGPSELGQWAANVRASTARGDTAPANPSPAAIALGLGGAYQRLIEPIADLLPTEPGARLIIVPDRELALIPWAALRDPTDDSRLIDRYTLSLAPSLQTLRETHRRRRNLPAGSAPMIIGNPAPMPTGLDPLPGSEREAIAIAQTQNATPLLGSAATETAVKQTWQTARWLHFATHGAPDWLALTPDATNDGLLTVTEIFNSQLQAEWVVMSACGTGTGDVTGEGVIGLARAFLKAGAPSVVATLWKVPDDATAFLMEVFYRELAAGATKAAALRTAQQETRAHPGYEHPHNWAAFILVGEAD